MLYKVCWNDDISKKKSGYKENLFARGPTVDSMQLNITIQIPQQTKIKIKLH